MFCRVCGKLCMPQYDLCHKHREEKIKKFKDSFKVDKCNQMHEDGAGHYCKLFKMDYDEDYPHKYLRVFCFGRKDSLSCKRWKNNKKQRREERGVS